MRLRRCICYTLPRMQNMGKGKSIGEVLRAEIVSDGLSAGGGIRLG